MLPSVYNFFNQYCVILAHNSILYCSIRYCACHHVLLDVLVIIGNTLCTKLYCLTFSLQYQTLFAISIQLLGHIILILSLIISIAFTSHIRSFTYILMSYIQTPYVHTIHVYRHIRDYNIIINKILFIIKIRKGNMKYSPILEPYQYNPQVLPQVKPVFFLRSRKNHVFPLQLFG